MDRIAGWGHEVRLRPADFWIGLAVVVAYVEVWSLFAPIDATTLAAPAVLAGGTGLIGLRRVALRRRLARRAPRGRLALIGVTGAAILWLANLALGKPTSWDSGLYHFPAIEYASRFAAIPGLANLHERLGATDAHLLFVALLDNGPWNDAGFHLANGLLVAVLLVDIVWRFLEQTRPPVTRNVAVLLVPATVATVAIDPGGRLSSPSLDLPMFVLVAVGTLYLCESVERFDASAALAATAAFGTACATRPYFLPAALVVLVAVAVSSRRRRRTLAVVTVIPATVLAAWAARQAVLAGYPLLPLKVGALPVDWRVPTDMVDEANAWVRSWARLPHEDPDLVLSSWNWLSGWLSRSSTDADLLGPLTLSIVAALPFGAYRPARRPMVAALVPTVLTLMLWFFAAPDPRFAYAPLWLLPIVFLASRPIDHRLAAVCTYIAVAAVVIGGAWRPVTSPGDGPFGSFEPPTPAVLTSRTATGLIVRRPVRDDRCWRVPLCAPSVKARLRLRGKDVASGFRMSMPNARVRPLVASG
jgi:hypothetical protein